VVAVSKTVRATWIEFGFVSSSDVSKENPFLRSESNPVKKIKSCCRRHCGFSLRSLPGNVKRYAGRSPRDCLKNVKVSSLLWINHGILHKQDLPQQPNITFRQLTFWVDYCSSYSPLNKKAKLQHHFFLQGPFVLCPLLSSPFPRWSSSRYCIQKCHPTRQTREHCWWCC